MNRNLRSSSRGAGPTLLEVMVAMTIFAMISGLFLSTYLDIDRQTARLESINRLASTGEKSINLLKDEILQSKEIFSRDARGLGYFGCLKFEGFAPLADSQLPLISPLGAISPSDPTFDPASVGNIVFFVRTMAPIWLHVRATDSWRVVNVYKFVCCYLSQDFSADAIGLPGTSGRLDLVWWESERLADHLELTEVLAALNDDDRLNVYEQLAAAEIQRTWDSLEEAPVAFWLFDPAENPYLVHELNLQLEPYDCYSLISELHGADPSTGSSVAYNGFPSEIASEQVPRFTQASGNFPAGFEVIAVGVQASRRVYMRLVTAVWYAQPETLFARETTVLVSPGIR